MIICFENGRLGNQLFQYAALRSVPGNHSLCLVGMKALKSILAGVRDQSKATWLERLLGAVGRKPLDFAARLRLLGTLEEVKSPEGPRMLVRRGLIPGLLYCRSGYFQSESLLAPAVVQEMAVHPAHAANARQVLDGLPADRGATFFVHVRRGDYCNWPSREHPAVLPLRWYQEQMNAIRSRFECPFFLLVSDDLPYVEEMFGTASDVAVCRGTEGTDFAVMSMCDGGILSASSFAWWAAFLARRKDGSGPFIGPSYWIGHARDKWIPTGFSCDWLTFAQVRSMISTAR